MLEQQQYLENLHYQQPQMEPIVQNYGQVSTPVQPKYENPLNHGYYENVYTNSQPLAISDQDSGHSYESKEQEKRATNWSDAYLGQESIERFFKIRLFCEKLRNPKGPLT